MQVKHVVSLYLLFMLVQMVEVEVRQPINKPNVLPLPAVDCSWGESSVSSSVNNEE